MGNASRSVRYARRNVGTVASFGGIRPVWKRHHRFTVDGTWDQIWSALLAEADAAGQIDWEVSVDSTINRAHQHATNTTRPDQDTGGRRESQEPLS